MNKSVSYAKTWIKGKPSPYQLTDGVHWPDWRNLIVWDAFFNNLTSGLMIFSVLAWAAGPPIFALVLPIALTVALVLVLIDLLVLIMDLGDPWRFLHSLRVLRLTSPLSVGVWGLVSYSCFLAAAVVFSWISLLCAPGANGVGLYFALAISRLAIILALIGAVVVILYKGVVFSCTSQPGVKDARWLTPFMVADSLLMGCSLFILIVAFASSGFTITLVLPYVVLVCARCLTFALLWQDVKNRARVVYDHENAAVGWSVFGAGGLVAIPLAFCGVPGICVSALIALACGILERYWFIHLTKPAVLPENN